MLMYCMKNKTMIFLALMLLSLTQISLHAQNSYLYKSIDAHKGFVKSVSFTGDGKYIVSSGHDGKIKVWNTKDNSLIHEFEFPGFSVTSPDGSLLAASGDDKNVKVWNISTGKEICSTGKLIDYRRSLAFSPNNKILAGCSFFGNTVI